MNPNKDPMLQTSLSGKSPAYVHQTAVWSHLRDERE